MQSKPSLWRAYKSLQARYGRSLFDFIPKHYIFPEDLGEFENATHKHPERVLILKHSTHRGVRALTARQILRQVLQKQRKHSEDNNMAVQKIPPMLLDGRMFDIGVYAVVTGISPLRVYIYRNILVRVCKVSDMHIYNVCFKIN